ncbi:unnamed protein product [Meganyctiphanes norvegica]|uniref:Uncharacterized protein n=1 Tax=Meganyctiphanes norvegica TaxID=48144 RepID=A0AAV2SGS6_MEGNR
MELEGNSNKYNPLVGSFTPKSTLTRHIKSLMSIDYLRLDVDKILDHMGPMQQLIKNGRNYFERNPRWMASGNERRLVKNNLGTALSACQKLKALIPQNCIINDKVDENILMCTLSAVGVEFKDIVKINNMVKDAENFQDTNDKVLLWLNVTQLMNEIR